jgi:hypothetical protein
VSRKKKRLTHIAIVLDKSSSMEKIRQDTVAAFNLVVSSLVGRDGQETTVSLFTFAYHPEMVFVGADPRTLRRLSLGDYQPYGNTDLFGGVDLAVRELKRLPGANDEDTSFLVITVTDGENNIYRLSPVEFRRLLKGQQDDGRWTFAFQLPKDHAKQFANEFGVPLENCQEWEQTSRGVREATIATQTSLGGYFIARSAGKKSVDNFYEKVTTDLSKVSSRDVSRQLDDLSGHFKQFTVPCELEVEEFIETETGKPYVVGSTFYQLMKPEKVGKNKRVLIQEKGKRAVYGGPDARLLIGLPEQGEADSKVIPGNHANYNVFIESTSYNRKLVRGTKVLWDPTHTKNKKPTWDPATV